MTIIPMSDAIVDEYGGIAFKDRNFTFEDKAFYFDNSIGLDIPTDSRPPIPVILGHLC